MHKGVTQAGVSKLRPTVGIGPQQDNRRIAQIGKSGIGDAAQPEILMRARKEIGDAAQRSYIAERDQPMLNQSGSALHSAEKPLTS